MSQEKPPAFNSREVLRWYRAKRFDELSKVFLDVLLHFERSSYTALNDRNRSYINAFLKNFLYFFTQEDYTVSDRNAGLFINLNSVIANLTAISDFGTTDPFLALMEKHERNFVKILTLCNPYNTVRIDRRWLFDIQPRTASHWYFSFLENYRAGVASKDAYEHLREHLAYVDDRLSVKSPFFSPAYFGCTYVDSEKDRLLKRKVNELLQQDLARSPVENRPNARKIGVFTSMWFPRQPVYRSQQPLLKALAGDYDLTLIHLGQWRGDLDTGLFSAVRHYESRRMGRDFSAFSPNEFGVAYFPDVGMTTESIFLSNLRIAPIQVSSYGHPVSTFGSKIDYWIGGADTEAQELAQQHYSERLVLIPGPGALPVYPQYVAENRPAAASPVLVNCAWSQHKINYPLLRLLKEVADRVERPVKFQFFPGPNRRNNFIPISRFIREVLGTENAEVHALLDYPAYMSTMERAHFTIDSYPFGGYNTIVDSLFLRKPVVAWCGDSFYNRISSFLLRHVGLDELIAATAEEYVQSVARLVDDRAWLEEVTEKLKKVNLDDLVFDRESSVYFKKAIDFLIENHETVQASESRAPIIIR